jgi:pentatricopeptide repeat protein
LFVAAFVFFISEPQLITAAHCGTQLLLAVPGTFHIEVLRTGPFTDVVQSKLKHYMLATLAARLRSVHIHVLRKALNGQRFALHATASTCAAGDASSFRQASRGGVANREKSRQIALMTKTQQRGYKGDWQSVLALLDKAKAKAFVPDSFVWRAAIEAMSGQWQEAVKLTARMQREGVQPNTYHYSAAIKACSRAVQWQAAEQLFTKMHSNGVQPDIYSYSAMITAYSSDNQWQQAEGVFKELQTRGLEPSLVTYNAMITAYDNGKQLQKAEQVFARLHHKGLQPDSVTYNAMITAYGNDNQWQKAESMFKRLANRRSTEQHYIQRNDHSIR